MKDLVILLKGFNTLYAQWLSEKLNLENEMHCMVVHKSENITSKLSGIHKPIILQLVSNRVDLEIITTRNAIPDSQLIIWWGADTISEEEIIRGLNLGASSIINDELSWEEIINTLHAVSKKGFHHNHITTEALFLYCRRSRILQKQVLGLDNLIGEREKKIIELRRSGKTSREIGEILFLSKKTIDKIFGDLYRRLNCNNFFELLTAYESGKANQSL